MNDSSEAFQNISNNKENLGNLSLLLVPEFWGLDVKTISHFNYYMRLLIG